MTPMTVDGVWPFCTECTMTTLPNQAPSTFWMMGFGTALGGALTTCPDCGSQPRRVFGWVFFLPLLPLNRFRIVRLRGGGYVGRWLPNSRGHRAAALRADREQAEQQVATRAAELAGASAAERPAALDRYAEALLAAGRVAACAAARDDLAAELEARHGPTDPSTLRALNDVAEALRINGQTAEFEAVRDQTDSRTPAYQERPSPRGAPTPPVGVVLFREFAERIAVRTAEEGERGPRTLRLRHALAGRLLSANRLDEAIRVAASCLADRRTALGADHVDTGASRRLLLAACAAARSGEDPRSLAAAQNALRDLDDG